MGEFYAWAVTGQVTNLEVWSDPDDSPDPDQDLENIGLMRIATHMAEQQKFLLRTRNGTDTPAHLIDSGVALQNGHAVTLVWGAREGSAFGQCIYVRNHTTGATARLMENVRLIRPQVAQNKVIGFGLLATVPAALAILTWLSAPGALLEIEPATFLVGAAVALVLLFIVGAIVSKLVFNYLRSEDEEKVWAAVSKALAAATRQPQPLRARLDEVSRTRGVR
jgi:hypothetical protein